MCIRCNATGFITANKIINNTLYAFLCNCGASGFKGLSTSIPFWNEKFRSEYTTDFDPMPSSPIAPVSRPLRTEIRPVYDKKLASTGERFDDDDDCPF